MAKRFTDTTIWQKEWYLKYNLKQKVLLRFLFDACDCAGIYEANYILLSVYIGEKIEETDILGLNKEKRILEKLPSGKFFIPSFISFQYGELSKNCKPHLAVFRSLEENNISLNMLKGYGKVLNNSIKPFEKGIQTLEEKEIKKKDKEKDIDTDKNFFEEFWSIYPKQRAGNKEQAYQAYLKVISEKLSTPENLIKAVKVYALSSDIEDGFGKYAFRWLENGDYNNLYRKIKKDPEEINRLAKEIEEKYGYQAKENFLNGLKK